MPGLLPDENTWVNAFAGYQPPQGLLPQVPDWLRGASYTPLRALGTVTDLGLMLTNALGLTDPSRQYMGSSDWMIDRAADAGLLGRRTGSGSELAGDILGQIAMPGVSAAEMGAYAKAVPYMLGIFGGMGAKTADTDALARAFAMEEAGQNREAIRQATGWFRAPWDKKWRFEIDDSAARYRGPIVAQQIRDQGAKGAADPYLMGFQGQSVEMLPHPSLYDAYPELSGMPFQEARKLVNEGYGGEYSDALDQITLAMTKGNKDTGKSLGLHEMQHAVQKRENFARGGSPEMFAIQPSQISAARQIKDSASLGADLVEYLSFKGITDFPLAENWPGWRAENALKEFAEWQKLDPRVVDGALYDLVSRTGEINKLPAYEDAAKLAQEAQKKYDELLLQSLFSPEENYRCLAGEAEARLVQQRRNLTAEQRGLLNPIEQMDTNDVAASAPITDELPFGLPERIQAFRTARANAALPVEQGGLGLGPANTAAERAGAMHYDAPAFHVTAADVPAFDISKASLTAKYGPAVYMGRDPQRMDMITNAVAKRDGGNINVMPLLVNKGNTYDAVTGEYPLSMFMRAPAENPLRALGVDTVEEANALASYDPSRIRSRFAAFDPMRRNEADLLASWLLPLIGGAGLLGGLGYLGQGDQPIY